MKDLILRFWRDEEGLETVEWAVLAAVIVGGGVALYTTIGSKVSSRIESLNKALT